MSQSAHDQMQWSLVISIRSVGAYVGLTPRRHASGAVDWTGRISKCGDRMVRAYLFEVAGVLLTRVPQWCRLSQRIIAAARQEERRERPRSGSRRATNAARRVIEMRKEEGRIEADRLGGDLWSPLGVFPGRRGGFYCGRPLSTRERTFASHRAKGGF